MEDKNFKYLNQENFHSDPFLAKYNKNYSNKPESHIHLNERLNDAYSDLEKLKRAVDEIKTSRGNLQTNFDRDRAAMRFVSENEEIKKNQALNFYSKPTENRIRHTQAETTNELRSPKGDPFNSNFITSLNNFKTPNRNESASKSNVITPILPRGNSKKKADEIINNFKEILKESEKYVMDPPVVNYPNTQMDKKYSQSVINSNNMNNLGNGNNSHNFNNFPNNYNNTHNNFINYEMNNNILEFNNSNQKFNNSTIPLQAENQENNFNSFVNKITSNNLKEEIDRLRISNQVLNKSNLDLKNQNKILQYEIEVLQNSNINNYVSSSNFDQNMNVFIEGLKNSLNSCQMSNKELGDIIENLQKKNLDLTNESNLLKEQSTIMRSEIETLKKKFCELKVMNENVQNEKSKIENECGHLELKLKEKDEKANEDEEKISNLFLLIENYEKNKNDNVDMLENLKNSLEVLKKSNAESEKEKSILLNKIEEIQNEILQKNYEIDQLKNSMQTEFKEKDYTTKEIKNLKDDILAKESYLKEIQIKLRNSLIEIEKNKTKMETINLNIEEKDHVINNLKTSLSYFTKTFEETKYELDNVKLKLEAEVNEKIKLLQNFELCRKKLNDSHNQLNELKNGKEELQMKNLKLEKELIEKRNKITQMEFENEVLCEKLGEKETILNKYKEESKVNKLNKITEDISANYNKGSEKKKENNKMQNDLIEDMVTQLKLKDEMINELLAQIEDMNAKREIERFNIHANEINNAHSINHVNIEENDLNIIRPNDLANNSNSINKSRSRHDNNDFIQNKSVQLKEDYKFDLPLNCMNSRSSSVSDLFLPMHTVNTPRLNELGNLNFITRNVSNEVINNIYAVAGINSIASYDLIKNKFELINLVDSEKYEENYRNEGIVTLNTVEGFYVITGNEFNQLYHFNVEERSMKLIAHKLNNNYKSGGMVYNNKSHNLYLLSGYQNKNCQKLSLSEGRIDEFPELQYDRAHASFVILNENYLYAFFGYSYLNASYLDTIERIKLDVSEPNWELVKYSYDNNSAFSTCLKSFVTIQKSDNEIYIVGGYDGKNRTNNKNLVKFNSSSSVIQSLPEVKSLFKLCLYDCTKENKSLSYFNEKGESFSAIFDDFYRLHLINIASLEHQLLEDSMFKC